MRHGYDLAIGGETKIAGRGHTMRYAAMQVPTWGKISGVIGSALLLAALERPELSYPVEFPDATSLLGEPKQGGQVRPRTPVKDVTQAGSAPLVVSR